jgi:N-acetylglutamate synthase-like GNAT family acetyltransferase
MTTATYVSRRLGAAITFRPFEAGDAKACSLILTQAFARWKTGLDSCPLAKGNKKLAAEYFRRQFVLPYEARTIAATAAERHYRVAVTEEPGVIIGVAGIERFPGNAGLESSLIPAAELKDLAIDPEYQNSGIGPLLVAELVSAAIGNGINHFYAYTPPEAKSLFTSMGFRQLNGGAAVDGMIGPLTSFYAYGRSGGCTSNSASDALLTGMHKAVDGF